MAIDIKKTVGMTETTTLMTMIQAINDGMRTMLEEDERTIILGEDIGKNGGVFRATEGLKRNSEKTVSWIHHFQKQALSERQLVLL